MTKIPLTLVLITGGRDYSDVGVVFDCLVLLNEMFDRPVIIHGDANGADSLAYEVCKEVGIEQVRIPAAWTRYNRAAGPIRNTLMLDLFPNLDMVLVFPGGTGTADMMMQAENRGIQVIKSSDLLEMDGNHK